MNVVATSEGTQLKARSKAQKLARRRGRPRMDATAGREPNGRPSRRKASKDARRHETEGNNMNVAVARRIKDYDLVDIRMKGGKILTAAEQAIDPRRGYVLGLLLLDGKITEPQHDAGLRYAEDMSRYYGLTGIRFPSARAQDLFAVRGDDGETTPRRADAASKARAKMAVLRDELLASGDINLGRKILHTVNEIALLDTSGARLWPEHMLGFLRKGLNRLVRHYGVSAN